MKKTIGIFCIAIMGIFQAKGQCNELFISEYVEGSRNNKALEIYNPTSNAVDLSKYRVTRWQNGSAAWTAQMSDGLSGTLQPKDVVVVVLDRRDTTKIGQDTPVVLSLRLKADLFLSKDYNTSFSMSFNGDDAMSLDKLNDATGKWVPVDIFGKIGERPSPAWSDKPPYTGTGTWYSLDKTLIRKDSVMTGVAKNPLEFNPKLEWVLNPRDMFDSLGFHTCLCTQSPSATVKMPVMTQVAVYPNPAIKTATVFLPFEISQLICLNAAGQTVSVRFNQVGMDDMSQYSLDVAHLSAGVYTLEFIAQNGEKASAKLIK
jgi:hypothetical protein